jgi:hypothetical protein
MAAARKNVYVIEAVYRADGLFIGSVVRLASKNGDHLPYRAGNKLQRRVVEANENLRWLLSWTPKYHAFYSGQRI